MVERGAAGALAIDVQLDVGRRFGIGAATDCVLGVVDDMDLAAAVSAECGDNMLEEQRVDIAAVDFPALFFTRLLHHLCQFDLHPARQGQAIVAIQ